MPGVAEVAPLGGFVSSTRSTSTRTGCAAYGIPIERVVEAVRGGNNDVGGRLLEFGGAEYMVRGRGYAKSIADIESIVARAERERHAGPGPRRRPA